MEDFGTSAKQERATTRWLASCRALEKVEADSINVEKYVKEIAALVADLAKADRCT